MLATLVLPGAAVHAGASADLSAVAAVPAGFVDELVVTVGGPTALDFTPDGRMLVTSQSGRIRVYQGADPPTLALTLSAICTTAERGLLGIAVDPAFATNRYIYVYYTSNQAGSCLNRVSRFVLPDSNVIDAATETVLVDDIPAFDGNHNAGDVQFGKDGYLYVSVGDGNCDYAGNSGCAGSNDAARDEHILLGKIIRITKDGGIPPSNPFQGAGTARCNLTGRTVAGNKCQETYAWGLRNPFRIAFDPNAAGTRFFINDVGQSAWEEIDEGVAGADYGWNVREGHCARGSFTNCGPPPAGMTNPVYDYPHNEVPVGGGSITGGAFVPNGVWPAEYDGDYLFGDYVRGVIYRLDGASGGYVRRDFVTGLGSSSAVHLRFGPHGAGKALYYTSYAGGGQVRRIRYAGSVNRAPTAALAANPTSGAAPLTVNFDGSGSSDPDAGDTLTYVWNFGDGSAVAETATATTAQTYTAVGTYTASLTVRDNRGAASTPATVRIDAGNTAPVPTITTPSSGQRFAVGEAVTLQGSASDAQDGPLPDSQLTWRVIRHHGTDHTHPWLSDTVGNNVAMPPAPGPEDIFTTTTSYLEVRLTATDSKGLSATTVREFRPKVVDLTFQTVPAGLRLDLFGASVTAPHVLSAWQAWVFGVSAGRQTDASGRTWIFDSWSDGGAASHNVTTGSTPATYTATFHVAAVPADFDGDADTDFSVWRPEGGMWYAFGGLAEQWGQAGDVPVPGQYDADPATDIAVWRPEGAIWYVRGGAIRQWGDPTDVPVPGDYDGDGDTDFAVWRPANGVWYVHGGPIQQWGERGDVPVPGQYDADPATEFAVWRPSNGVWYVHGGPIQQWGERGDVPVPGDYDRDGDTDFAVWRPATGVWYVHGGAIQQWGERGDVPVPGDYDGDGDNDFAVWRPSSATWYVFGGPIRQWGDSTDKPLPPLPSVAHLLFPTP